MSESKKPNQEVGGRTVVVASKLSMPLILELYDYKKRYEPILGGGTREYYIWEKRYGAPTFTINGNSYAQNTAPGFRIEGGYALTYDIPKEFWDEWFELNKEADYIKNNIIFAHEQVSSTVSEAKEKEEIKSGFERLDPNNLPKRLQTGQR